MAFESYPAGDQAVIPGEVRPDEYGAVGDGIADDTAPILAAAEAASAAGKILRFTSGKTYLSNTVDYTDLTGDLVIEAEGATINWAQAAGIQVRGGGYLKVAGGTWNNQAAGFCFNFPDAATYVGMDIKNVEVIGGRCGVWSSSVSTIPVIKIRSSTFDGMDQAGIQCIAKGIVDGLIDGCTVKNIQGHASVGTSGITIGGINEVDLPADGRVTVSNCYVDSIHTTFAQQLIGILVYGRQSSITDNYVSNCWGDGTVGDSGIYDKSIYSTKDSNRLFNAGGGVAAIASKGDVRGGVDGSPFGYGSIVADNTVLYDGNFPHATKVGVLMGSEETVTGNRFENCQWDINAGGVVNGIIADNYSKGVEEMFLHFANATNIDAHDNQIDGWLGNIAFGQAVRALFVSTNGAGQGRTSGINIVDNHVFNTVSSIELKYVVFMNSANEGYDDVLMKYSTIWSDVEIEWFHEGLGTDYTNVRIELVTADNTFASGYKTSGLLIDPNPAALGKIGQVLVTAGRPGAWKEFGAIDA